MVDQKKNIYTALLKVMEEVSYIQKERISGVQYAIKSEEAVLEAIRPALIKNEIIVFPTEITDIHHERYENVKRDGNITNWNMVGFNRTYRFFHVPSETFIDVQSYGVGTDTGDKAANGAMTVSKKYALLDALLVITGEDPDKVASPSEAKKSTEKKSEWKPGQIRIVLDTSYIVEEDKAIAFLNMSGLKKSVTQGAIKKFVIFFQAGLDEDMTKPEALKYAQENWNK